MYGLRFGFVAAAVVLVFGTARGEVVRVSDQGFLVRSTIQAPVSPERAFQILSGEISRWWDSSHTYSGDSANLSLKPEPGGCFCERLPNGGGIRHAEVIYVDPGVTLRLEGGLGPLQTEPVNGVLTFHFKQEEGGCRVEMTYNVGGPFPGGYAELAQIVDGVMSGQLERLRAHLTPSAQ